MPRVFVDTAAWIALVNSDDALHQQAARLFNSLRTQNTSLVTTEFVLLEVADALSLPRQRSSTVAFIDGLRHLPMLEIVPARPDLWRDGWELYRQRPDKDWGLRDCTSFAVMAERKITQAFTSDHHFRQAGFSVLLSVQ